MSLFDDASSGLTEVYSYTRSTRGVGSDGRASTPSTVTTAAAGVFEPISGRELQRMPEGDRDRNWMCVWTSAQLHTGDLVSYGGLNYEVGHVDPWNTHGGYTKAQIAEIES